MLLRDRVGLVFMTLAPVVVITVAGLSLANLYGAKGGTSAFVLPLVDEDGGRIGRAIAERLRDDRAVRVTLVAERAAARALVRAKQTGAALVVPAGTSAALAAGQPSQLILYTDPVKAIELDVIRDLVQEIRHEVEAAARNEAVAELEATRQRALEARGALERAAADLRRELDDAAAQLAAARSDASRASREGQRVLSASVMRLRAEQKAAATRRARFDLWTRYEASSPTCTRASEPSRRGRRPRAPWRGGSRIGSPHRPIRRPCRRRSLS